MNIKGFKRMLFGEKMPDKDDPQYKERYEREVQAGHKFAKATRIDLCLPFFFLFSVNPIVGSST